MPRRIQSTVAEADVVTQKMRIEKAKQDIVKYRNHLRLDGGRPGGQKIGIFHYTVWMGALAEAYKEAGDIPMMKWACRELIAQVKARENEIPGANREPTGRDQKQASSIAHHFKKAHFMMAPHSFHHFLLAMEWNFPPESKFYANRWCVMQDWAKNMQLLEDGNYEILGLSAPPRSGKTGIGTLFLIWLMGRHPEKSMIFATHTSRMARKEFSDIQNLIADPRREWDKIFPGLEISSSAEDLWIDVSPKGNPNNYKTLYCTAVDANKAGVMEASHLIYCDDLIGGIEEATNPTRLNTAWEKYSTDILQRKNGNVKILHIATRWSTNDPLTRVEEMNRENPKAKFICVPGLNEDGESNFNFPYNPLDKQHFETLRESMDPVSFSCIIMQRPVEREGVVFLKENFTYYNGTLPEGDPDLICAAVDVALGGGDSLSMPIAFVYGKDVYIVDVIHNRGNKQVTIPMIIAKTERYGIEKLYFEFNSGGDFMKEDVAKLLRDKGIRCNVTGGRAPTVQSKLQRILSAQPEISGSITDGSGYRLHFLSAQARQNKQEYCVFMNELFSFSQIPKRLGKQRDDAPDALATLILYALPPIGKKNSILLFSRKLLAI